MAGVQEGGLHAGGREGGGGDGAGRLLITGVVVLIVQGVPALDLLVLVLQALVPVLQALSLRLNAQLAATCHHYREE